MPLLGAQSATTFCGCSAPAVRSCCPSLMFSPANAVSYVKGEQSHSMRSSNCVNCVYWIPLLLFAVVFLVIQSIARRNRNSIRVLNERSVNDGGNLCPHKWLVTGPPLKSVELLPRVLGNKGTGTFIFREQVIFSIYFQGIRELLSRLLETREHQSVFNSMFFF